MALKEEMQRAATRAAAAGVVREYDVLCGWSDRYGCSPAYPGCRVRSGVLFGGRLCVKAKAVPVARKNYLRTLLGTTIPYCTVRL